MSIFSFGATKSTRLKFLDGLRAIAALYVLFHHARNATFADRAYSGKGLLNVVTFPFAYGHLAVAMFIVLRVFLCQDISHSILWEWNLPLWSIAVEWRIYLIFPLIVVGIGRFGVEKTVLTTRLCSLVLLLGLAILAPLAPGLTIHLMEPVGVMPQLLGLFGFGVLAALWSRSGSRLSKRQLRLGAVVGMGLAVGLEVIWQKSGRELPRFVSDYPFGLGAGCLLAYLAQTPTSRLRALVEWRPLVALGAISYSVYLLHQPIIGLISRGLMSRLPLSHVASFMLLSALSLLVTLAVSGIFFRIVEQPTLRKVARARC